MSHLVLIPTPIGNLGDITLRALEVMKHADLLLAEDTRVTQKLLRHFDIQVPLKSFHVHNEHATLDRAVETIRQANLVGLVSDAGTPSISDPGFLLVRACIEAGIKVECLPGPSALLPALAISGLPTDRFIFEGFLPPKKGRVKRIENWKDETRTVVLYESPHRLLKTLGRLLEVLGESRRVAVVKELSKIHETVVRGTLEDAIAHFNAHAPKGEFVLVIGGIKVE